MIIIFCKIASNNTPLDLEKYMLPCFSKSLFGMDCPGCGAQRSLLFFVNGDFTAAFKMFPAIYTTLFFFLFLGLHLMDKSRNYSKIVISLAIANGVIMIVSYIYKITNF